MNPTSDWSVEIVNWSCGRSTFWLINSRKCPSVTSGETDIRSSPSRVRSLIEIISFVIASVTRRRSYKQLSYNRTQMPVPDCAAPRARSSGRGLLVSRHVDALKHTIDVQMLMLVHTCLWIYTATRGQQVFIVSKKVHRKLLETMSTKHDLPWSHPGHLPGMGQMGRCLGRIILLEN